LANVSKLLYSTVEDESFHKNILADASSLTKARTKVRNHLRLAFSLAGRKTFGIPISPRFFTQGSYAYKTLNDPAWPPKQQKDLDDGCYLPLSFVRGERPSVAAELFFTFVDESLKALAKTENWTHEKKPTCSRLMIDTDSHIDVPLYAIPDREFRLLEEKAMATRSGVVVASAAPDVWGALPSDAVLLAHRNDDWIVSDPRKIHDWFEQAVSLYGERLRRDCRYLKAWRDHNKLDDPLKSIVLMASVWYAYEAIRGPFLSNREDERLLQVVERLPRYLIGPLLNPACQDEDLNRMSMSERTNMAAQAHGLVERLRDTMKRCDDKQQAVDLLTAILGPRVPDRSEFVSIPPPGIATVLAQPKKTVAAPEIGRSISG
jgi:hypothetical protein